MAGIVVLLVACSSSDSDIVADTQQTDSVATDAQDLAAPRDATNDLAPTDLCVASCEGKFSGSSPAHIGYLDSEGFQAVTFLPSGEPIMDLWYQN